MVLERDERACGSAQSKFEKLEQGEKKRLNTIERFSFFFMCVSNTAVLNTSYGKYSIYKVHMQCRKCSVE